MKLANVCSSNSSVVDDYILLAEDVFRSNFLTPYNAIYAWRKIDLFKVT
jgi:hypothetical protein